MPLKLDASRYGSRPISMTRAMVPTALVGVQRREHHVAGQRRFDGGLERFDVANLADHDDVGILPQNRAQASRECEAGFVVGLPLIDAAKRVLDRVLDRHDVLAGFDELRERAVERRRLAAAGRSGDEHHALGLMNDVAVALEQWPG